MLEGIENVGKQEEKRKMPLPMVHLGTAHGMIEEGLLHVRDFPAFYLGSIAPDGVHMRKDPGPEAKVASHLGTRHTSDLTPVAMFLQRHKGRENADFFLGYVVHVLTDAYWNELVYGPYTARYGADPSPVQTVRQAYYSDTDQIDLLLYRELPWRERVWEYLRQARGQDVGEVLSGQEADLWKDRTLNWYAQQPEKHLPLRYIGVVTVREFMGRAAIWTAGFIRKYASL